MTQPTAAVRPRPSATRATSITSSTTTSSGSASRQQAQQRGRGREARPPPTPQVYTRGTTGKVQTHYGRAASSSGTPRRRSKSQSRSSPQQQPSSSGLTVQTSTSSPRRRSTSQQHKGSSSSARRYYGDGVYVKTSASTPPLAMARSAEDVASHGSGSQSSFGKGKKGSSYPIISSPSRDASPASRSTESSQKLHSKSVQRVLDDLNRPNQSAERRIAAITTACETFDHHDESKHNLELHQGAVPSLCQRLAASGDENEVRMVCAALEMVLARASPHQVEYVYDDKTNKNLIPLLLRCMDHCETGTLRQPHADICWFSIAKIFWSMASRCPPELQKSLCRQPGFLDMLARCSSNKVSIGASSDSDSQQNSTSSEASTGSNHNAMRVQITAALASCPDNRLTLYEHEGLCTALLKVAHGDPSEMARQSAAAALMDLSSMSANQGSMASDDKLLGTLVKMVLVEKSAATRDLVLTALQNLAFAKENRMRLVSFKNGIVLEALKKCLASDSDAKARRRAAGVLTNLACDETAQSIGNHRGMLDTLAIVSSKDDSQEVQTRASMALGKLAGFITVKMDCHESLLDALVVASISTAPNNMTAILRVKARDPDNRQSMAHHSGVLDTLADVCESAGSQAKDRDNALRSIMHLVNEEKNRKIMCNKTILDALVAGANYENDDLQMARESAIRAMERLATEVTNRPIMARHGGLLVAVAKAVEREARAEEDGQDSEHGFLAKPLLMSLLVAM